MTLDTRKKILEAAAIILIGFGLLVAIAAAPLTSGPATLLADIIFWPADAAQSLGHPEQRLLAAISGGVMAGWGSATLLLVRGFFASNPHAVKCIIAPGMLVWFLVDSTGSLLAGAPLNAALNLVFLGLFLLPLSGKIASASHI